MIGRRATVGLSLLCALAFCALATQSASAQVGTKAVNTTAFTCKQAAVAGEGQFVDGHCDVEHPTGEGNFDHVPLPDEVGEPTSIEASSEKTASTTEADASITIKFESGGEPVEITCKEADPAGEDSFLENEQKDKNHTVTGTIATNFTKCEVKKPAKCEVKEPIEFKAKFEGVEKLGPNKNTMGVEFQGDPDPDSPFMSIVLKNKGLEKCALNGKTFDIDGTAIATGTPNPGDKFSGATWKFEPGNEMQTLTIEGVNAELTATLTPRMSVREYAIPLTTVT